MKKRHFIVYISFILMVFGNCQKKQIEPQNYFDATINNKSEQLKLSDAYISKGITEIKVYREDENLSKSIIITINSDKIGRYHQYFDYKTGVSMSECGLNYEIHEKEDVKNPKYFKSNEGQVEITDINFRKRMISGTYNFRINSLSEKNIPNSIKGKFINIPFKRD
jgi:hypothetical protein